MNQNFCESPLGCTKVEAAETKRSIGLTLLTLVFVLGVILFIVVDPIEKITISGYSMNPTLRDGQTLIGYKLNKNYKVNDIVVAHPAAWNLDHGVCKRILGVPGDTIVVDGNKLMINGINIDTGNIPSAFQGHPYQEYTLKQDEYFLVGDNRANSLDSRSRGPVLKSEISSVIIQMH